MSKENELGALLRIAAAAGKEIISVYESTDNIEVEVKADNSPLTEADKRAHQLIEAELEKLFPSIPILSEESKTVLTERRMGWSRFWIVDPLDGTKEFINRNGEFTVNIALIKNGTPELGIVHVPLTGINYVGKLGAGAWKVGTAGEFEKIAPSKFNKGERNIRAVASRSHRGKLIDKLIETIESKLGRVDMVNMGSSLKICLLAEGEADIYPRLAPTSEWDTAAAHAVLKAAGGEIYDTSFEILRYNQKETLLNPYFIAVADTHFNWSSVLLPVFSSISKA
ncbi:MAG: 3'(2'),5'-bisphosphate nucleotidase [Gammaproteobacteria bacterium]|nr:3'(2'),5'-bisphosphate nucleotidase [Gammaproteobacteria bacterium]